MNDEFSEFLIAGSVGLLGWFFGGLDGYVKVLITFTIIDYITGICKAGTEGKISSSECFRGIERKIVMFFLVGIAHLIDQLLPGGKEVFRTPIILFYIGNEGISIIENADKEYQSRNFFAANFWSSVKRISRRPKSRPLHDLLLLRFRVNIHSENNDGGVYSQ